MDNLRISVKQKRCETQNTEQDTNWPQETEAAPKKEEKAI